MARRPEFYSRVSTRVMSRLVILILNSSTGIDVKSHENELFVIHLVCTLNMGSLDTSLCSSTRSSSINSSLLYSFNLFETSLLVVIIVLLHRVERSFRDLNLVLKILGFFPASLEQSTCRTFASFLLGIILIL
jgi:hypothetical protein